MDLSRIPSTENNTDTVVVADTLRRAARDLSDTHRAILSELYFEGHSIQEAADRLVVPVGTVKSRAHYAMQFLRRALGNSG